MNDVTLQHHGVKGMKWGVRRYVAKQVASQIPRFAKDAGKRAGESTIRRASDKVIKKKYSDRTVARYDKKISKKVGELNEDYDKNNAIQDYRNLGKNSVKRINNRMNKGSTYVKAHSVELGRKAAVQVVTDIGKKTVKSLATAAIVKVGADCARYYMNQRMGVKLLDNPNIIDLGPDMYKILN